MAADEAFCCGTAAVISPIASITKGENTATYGDGTPQPITVELYEALTGIQNQTAEDNFSWIHPLPENI